MPRDSSQPPNESDRRRQAAEIFADALEAPPEARDAFLRRACGEDGTLLREVHTLLRALPQAGNWFDRALEAQDVAEPTVVLKRVADPTGRIVSHYRLEEFLGAGGMGEVYRATDVALGRDAAVKLLRPDVSPKIRDRLVREAHTNARLSHPGIAQYFDSGVAEGVDFLAMEFVPGKTLRSRLRQGALPANEALSITASVLEALVHAHFAGYLHRDIKPENVMLTERGGAKLLDFGLAKEIGRVEAEVQQTQVLSALAPALTMHGMILGTPGYMSPEQLRGEAVDERTDVFSVGAILYEMLSGEPAFPGTSTAEKAQSTVSRELPSVQGEQTPPDIDVILQRAVARDATDRYPSASAFLSELRKVASGEAVAILPNTVAVMDLTNLRGDEEDAWIGTGVAESLAVDLRRAQGLDIVPRNKVVKLHAKLTQQGKGSDPVALGLAVGCRWVLTGSFQRVGPSLRLTMQLVEVSTGKDLWTEKLDGKVDDVFGMQDRLAVMTAESLEAVIPEESRSTPALDAFACYTKAKALLFQWDRGLAEQGHELLVRTLELDPTYAPALATMAQFHAPIRWGGSADPRDLATAMEFASRAIEADPDLAEAHLWKGYAQWRQNDVTGAIDSFRRAIELDPSDFQARYFTGCCLFQLGRLEEALVSQRQAMAREPKAPYIVINLSLLLVELGDMDATIWALEKMRELETDPDALGQINADLYSAPIHRRAGRLEEARRCCVEGLQSVEQRDSFLRPLERGIGLTELGRIALDQGDLEAARVAFEQAVSLIRGHRKGIGAGHILVQALAGLSRATQDPGPHLEARRLFETREDYDFSWGGLAGDSNSLLEMAQAAQDLGREREAQELYEKARKAGIRRPLK